jgi:hypothetical protein
VDRRLWFVQLSGWPVFLTLMGLLVIGMVALSILFTRLGTNRAVIFNWGTAAVAVAIIAALGLAIATIVSRW